MMILLHCAVQYLIRMKMRTMFVIVGLASAFGATALMYGIAGEVSHKATRSLRWVIADADLWLVPSAGVRLDSATGAIVCNVRLPADVEDRVRRLDQDAKIRSFQVSLTEDSSAGPLVVYSIHEPQHLRVTVCSADVWERHGSSPFDLPFDQGVLKVAEKDDSLPPHVITRFLPELEGAAAWITIETRTPGRWVRSRDNIPFVVRDSPRLDSAGGDSRPVLYPITTSAGRFNAFSFDARFDALVINRELSSALGLFARFVLAFGCIVSVASSLFGLQEKASLIAVLTAHGITGEMIGILLAEAGVVVFVSWLLGVAVAALVLALLVFRGAGWGGFLEGMAITTVFIPSLILVCTLIAAWRLLSVSPVRLIRDAFA